MGVEGYTGWHGDGKTYNAVLDCLHLLDTLRVAARAKGRPAPVMATNADVRGTIRFDTWDELMDLVDTFAATHARAIVLVDEAGVFLPARFWSKMDPRVLRLLQERRKTGAGVDLIWTAPSFRHVDTMVRDVTQQLHACKRVGGSEYGHDGEKPPRGFKIHTYDPEAYERAAGRPMSKRRRPFVPELAGVYGTSLVEMAEGMRKPVAGASFEKRPTTYGPGDGLVQPAEQPTTVEVVVAQKPKRQRKPRAPRGDIRPPAR